ncbi:MAG: YabP/YqfC family sporulation protein [Candidatus Fimisoma sp.]|nr:YabP/YqfC family sporulation protein [Bacillota bacterium]MDD7286008.1 YabP/YqfC family sporulation protein [Bacillota bacterium]MDY4748250.1 YabP/YqfC family sporulation protein [Candidatus Fimisoma sp.]
MENHYITLENREKITISQVLDVDAFDEDNLWANLKDGGIELTGEKLNIEKLDLEEGMLVVSGKISSLSYTDKKTKETGGLLRKFRKNP